MRVVWVLSMRAATLAATTDDAPRDAENVVNAAVVGLSNKAIAKRFGCSLDAVRNVLDRHAIEPEGRATILALQIERMKQLQSHFLRFAIENGDSTAGTLVVKVGQRDAK